MMRRNNLDREFDKIRACTPNKCPFCGGSDQTNLMLVAPNLEMEEKDFWVIFYCIACNRNFESNGETVREYKSA